MAKIVKVISDIIFVLLICFLCLYFALRFMGIAEIYKVQTGSMEDGIHAGDYILIYKKNLYNIGDVVTYKKDNYHVTHRIIKKSGNKIVTKGDANNIEDDEINTSSIIGKVIYSGGYLNFVIDYKYAIASVLLALYLFSCYFSKKVDEETTIDESLEEENDEFDKNIIEEESLLEEDSIEDVKEDIDIEEKTDKEKSKSDEKKDVSFIYEKTTNKKNTNKKNTNKRKNYKKRKKK